MKVAIMQPTYFPWSGYFDLMDQVDRFVFLDDVQFAKRSWQQRNRLRTPKGLEWITVPVFSKGRYDQQIRDVEIREPGRLLEKHMAIITSNYSGAPYFGTYAPSLFEALKQGASTGSLLDLNVAVIESLASALGIAKVAFCASHDLPKSDDKTLRLVDICRYLGATEYISPMGSIDYLADSASAFDDAGVALRFQNYIHPVYTQLNEPFIPYASVVDMLFNAGPRSLELIRNGRGKPLDLEAAKTRNEMS